MPTLKQNIRDLIDAEWKRNRSKFEKSDENMWSLSVSPPLPAAWPLTKETSLTVYVYGSGVSMESIGRFEVIARPWAQVEFSHAKPNELNLTVMTHRLDPIGQQGIRPLTAEEIKIGKIDIYDSLYALSHITKPDPALEAQALATYKFWKQTNGIIAQLLLIRHAELDRGL